MIKITFRKRKNPNKKITLKIFNLTSKKNTQMIKTIFRKMKYKTNQMKRKHKIETKRQYNELFNKV